MCFIEYHIVMPYLFDAHVPLSNGTRTEIGSIHLSNNIILSLIACQSVILIRNCGLRKSYMFSLHWLMWNAGLFFSIHPFLCET